MMSSLPHESCPKAAVSLAEMARLVGLSRNHFKMLCKRGVFPMPQYTSNGRPRPYFDLEAQDECRRVRQTNIGHNGQFVLFYPPRKPKVEAVPPVPANGKRSKVDDRIKGLVQAIKHLGLVVTAQQVESAVPQVFPEGLPGDDGAVIRALYLHLKRSVSG